MKNKIIAIDFDGVLAQYKEWGGPVPGEPIKGSLDALRRLRKAGWKIIIWSCRGDKYVRQWLIDNKYPFDSINENLESGYVGPEEYISRRKVYADVYVDDRGIGFKGDWNKTLGEIDEFKPYPDKDNALERV